MKLGPAARWLRTTITMAVAVILMSFGVAAVSATPSWAAVTPCGSSCDNKNPESYNACVAVLHYTPATCSLPDNVIHCADDAVTERTTSDGNAFLRYSASCRTAWVKVAGDSGSGIDGCIHNYNSNGSIRITECAYGETGVNYSVMVNTAGTNSKVCTWGLPGGGSCSIITSAFKG